jgi:putative resolvase
VIERSFTGWVRLAEWAWSFGVHPQTAYRWFREDRMPVSARCLPSGTMVVDPPGGDGSGRTVVYVRVSSHDQGRIWRHGWGG